MSVSAPPLDSFLDPGEKLLWSGRPKQGLRLQASDIFMIPFSLMWGGFAIFWEAMALGLVSSSHARHPAGIPGIMAWVFPLWGLPFVLVGLYMIFGRFFYDAALRARTWYGLTDQRLIIRKSLVAKSVTSFDHATFTNLSLVERSDRSGDILFGLAQPGNFPLNGFGSRSGRFSVPGFYLLPDAREVYNRIRLVQQSARKRETP